MFFIGDYVFFTSKDYEGAPLGVEGNAVVIELIGGEFIAEIFLGSWEEYSLLVGNIDDEWRDLTETDERFWLAREDELEMGWR